MTYPVSSANVDDLEQVAALINDYVQQNLGMPQWPCAIAAFQRDYASGCFRMNVVHCENQVVGFIAWLPSYDLHHCVHGATVIDLYVAPAYRFRGLAVALVCAIAAEVTRLGWGFIRGQALSGRAARLYKRVGVCFGGNEYNVSGKALLQLAGLSGKPAREIVRGLPTQAMNYEA